MLTSREAYLFREGSGTVSFFNNYNLTWLVPYCYSASCFQLGHIIPGSWCTVFWIYHENNHVLIVAEQCWHKVKDFSVRHAVPVRSWHKKLIWSITTVPDPNWPKSYFIPWNIMFSLLTELSDQEVPITAWGLNRHWPVGREQLHFASVLFIGFYSSLSFCYLPFHHYCYYCCCHYYFNN